MPLSLRPRSQSRRRVRRRSLSVDSATSSCFYEEELEKSCELSKSESDANSSPSTPFESSSSSPIAPLNKRRKPRGRALLRRVKSTDDDNLHTQHRSAPLTMRRAISDDGSSMRLPPSDPDASPVRPFDSPEESLPQRKRKMRGRALLPRSKSSDGDMHTQGSGPPLMARRTISGDLSEMRRALKNKVASGVAMTRSFSSDGDILGMRMALDKNTNDAPAEPAPLLVDISKLNPLDEQDRAHYQELDAQVQKLLKKTPQAARATYDFPMGRNRTVSQHILSHLVAMGAGEDTIKLALRANPKALHPNADFRSTTLHTACSLQHVPLPIVMLLHRKWRMAIRAKNKHAFLPLHNACQAPHCNPELIRYLVKMYPEALMEINKLGDTPLRTAQRNEKVMCPDVLAFLKQETERVFDQAGNRDLKDKVMERQTWGSSDLTDYYTSLPMELSVPKPSFPANSPRMRRTAVASRSPTRREVSPAA